MPLLSSPETFVWISTLRWPLEKCFQEGKSFLGMNRYQHQSLRAWRRHMGNIFLAQLFYLQVRRPFKKN